MIGDELFSESPKHQFLIHETCFVNLYVLFKMGDFSLKQVFERDETFTQEADSFNTF